MIELNSKEIDPLMKEWLSIYYRTMQDKLIFDHYYIPTETIFFELDGKRGDYAQELIHLEKFLQTKTKMPRLMIGIIRKSDKMSNLIKFQQKE